MNAKERQKLFDLVWRRVEERYYDPTFNGVNWHQVRKRYAPKVAQARSESEFYTLMNRMLGELKRSHFQLIPPTVYVGQEELAEQARKAGDGEIGITVQLVEGQPAITRVEAGSSAAQGGLRPGFILTHIEEEPLSRLQEKIASRKERPTMARFLLSYLVLARLRGPVGSTVRLRYLDERNASHTVTLRRQPAKGQPVKFGELPTLHVFLETQRLAEGIGYIRFNLFMMPLLEPIKQAIRSFHEAPGIILDLRGNIGGVGGMAIPIAALFYEKRTILGTMRMRRGEFRFVVFPSPDPYKGPVVILIDETTASTAEVLAAGMQENGRALIVGTSSLGAVLPSVIEKLPGGARLQYAVADFKTPKGVLLEGRGVLPNVPVELTRQLLLAGDDPVLTKSVSLLMERKRGTN